MAEEFMKYILVALAIAGIVVSSLALREHYRTGESPCSINEKWDCGTVNKSPFAEVWGVPIAALGIGGYALLGLLAFRRSFARLLDLALMSLGFSLYLAHIEAHVLGVWCIYCVISLGIIALMSLLTFAALVQPWFRRPGVS
jgi:vitamin-K-epoxide reductase (warfarin-sensitive)